MLVERHGLGIPEGAQIAMVNKWGWMAYFESKDRQIKWEIGRTFLSKFARL